MDEFEFDDDKLPDSDEDECPDCGEELITVWSGVKCNCGYWFCY